MALVWPGWPEFLATIIGVGGLIVELVQALYWAMGWQPVTYAGLELWLLFAIVVGVALAYFVKHENAWVTGPNGP